MEERTTRIIASATAACDSLQLQLLNTTEEETLPLAIEEPTVSTQTRKRGRTTKRGTPSPALRKNVGATASKRLQSLISPRPVRATG